MSMLRLMQLHLPIGDEAWKAVALEHSEAYPLRADRHAIMRKYGNLHRKPIPTGDPNCPEEVRFAKRIKFEIGNKASVGDAEEAFELEEIAHSESGANPNPEPNQEPAAAEANEATEPTSVATASAVSAPPSALKKRTYSAKKEKEEKKDNFIEVFRMQLLSQSQNAELDRQQRREEERARREEQRAFMQMLGTMATAWASGNTGASIVSRPGEQPVIEGMEAKAPPAPPSPASTVSSSSFSAVSPPKRSLRRKRGNK
jgi:hypothetical protein